MNLFLLYLLSPQTRKDKATSMSLIKTLLNEKLPAQWVQGSTCLPLGPKNIQLISPQGQYSKVLVVIFSH